VVGPNGGLANVVVCISQGLSGNEPVASQPVKMEQKGCQYFPHVVAMNVGQHLTVINDDKTAHNIHPEPKPGAGNIPWNKSQMEGSPAIDVTWSTPEVAIPVKCNIHPSMRAYVAVVKGPFGVSNDSGSFKLDNIPPPIFRHQCACRHPPGCQWNSHTEPVDGTILGRSNAPHGRPASTLGQAELAQSISFWNSSKRLRWPVPCVGGELAGCCIRHLHAAIVSACLHSAEAQDAVVHADRRVSRRNAGADRIGRRFGRHRCERRGFCSQFFFYGSFRIFWRSP